MSERTTKQAIEAKIKSTISDRRLDRGQVERSIAEMWEAILLNQQGDDPEGDHLAREQARAAEAKLRARLEAQDKLDRLAPEAIEACRDGLNAILLLDPAPTGGQVFAAVKRLQRVIAAAER